MIPIFNEGELEFCYTKKNEDMKKDMLMHLLNIQVIKKALNRINFV